MRRSNAYFKKLQFKFTPEEKRLQDKDRSFQSFYTVSYGEGANSGAKYDVCIKQKHEIECHENSVKFKPITIVNLRYRETDLNSHI